jgi:spore maturation protein CgeB
MRPESIVVLGPSYGRYPESIAKGFRQNGIETIFFSYPQPPVGPSQIVAWDYLPRIGLTAFRTLWLSQTVRNVIKACKRAQLFVLIKGDQLPLDQYESLMDTVKCPTVLWLMDSIDRVANGLERANMANALLFFEGTDRPLLSQLKVPYHQVALAADPDCYYPMNECRKDLDVSFVGRLYDNRLAMLDSIMTIIPHSICIKANFVGSYRSRLHPSRTSALLGRYPMTSRYLIHTYNWNHDEINLLNNRSSVCLNVFHPQSKDSLNMRTFETCCSGSFLLCESNHALNRCFAVGQEMEVFESPQEAAEKILYYLRNNTIATRIALAGRERVLKDHTVKARTAQILATLEGDGLQ